MIHSDMTFDDYFAVEAWGASSLRAMRLGPPARVLWERANPKPDTEATILGTAAHCAILTPDLFDGAYALKPEGMTFASKEGKAWRDAALAEGRRILTAEQHGLVASIRAAATAKAALAASIASAAGVEVSVLWADPDCGEPCKARPDWYDSEAVYDLKITRDAGPRLAFAAYRNGWWHQSAHYRAGLRANGVQCRTGRIAAINPAAPHYIWLVEAREGDLDILALENANTLRQMRECREAGVWPDTPDQWDRIELPQYALQEVVATADALEVDGEQ